MIVLRDPQQTSPAVRSKLADQVIVLQTGLIPGAVFGTSAGTSWVRGRGIEVSSITTVPAMRLVARLLSIADEVRELRDRISSRGLTRQDIARAIGVDRRSLSGWVRGEIRPADERVIQLRSLAKLVVEIDYELPGRAREVLLTDDASIPLPRRVDQEGVSLVRSWQSSHRTTAHVTVTRRRVPDGEPIWASAARALAEGRLKPPASVHAVRSPATYEMDLTAAAAFQEEGPQRGRQAYK